MCTSCSTEMQEEAISHTREIPQSIAIDFEADTRVHLENGKTTPTVGDLFYVFNKINHCDTYIYNGNTNEDGKPIIEFYQATGYTSHTPTDKVLVVYNNYMPTYHSDYVEVFIKTKQYYKKDSFGVQAAPMVSISDDLGSIYFKNVCGFISIPITGNGESVKKIELSSNGGEALGTMVLENSGAKVYFDDFSIRSAETGNSKIELSCDSDNSPTLGSTPTNFYFAVRPTTLNSGLSVKITCTDGTVMTKSTSKKVKIGRNEIQPMETFAYAGESIQLNISDLNYPVFRDLTYSEGYANTFEVKVANNKYQNGFFIFYNPDYQPSGKGDAGTLNGEYEIVTDEIGTKTYTAKTFIADPSRCYIPYDGDLYYFKSGKVTVSGNNASTTIAFDAIVTNSEGGELPLKSQCTLESMGYTTLTKAKDLGFSSFVYQAAGGYFTMQSTSGQNTMTIELKTTAKTPNELKDKTFTDTALTDYISSGSLRMGDLTSYDTLVGSITFTAKGLNYTMTTKGLKFIDGAGNIYQIPDGGYSVSLKQGTINSGGGGWL